MSDQDKQLNELAKLVIDALDNAGASKAVDKGENEKAQYSIGSTLSEVAKLLSNKKAYGDWLDKYILNNGKRTVAKRTLNRWSKLNTFGRLEHCQKVGFTNVYKLSVKGYEGIREQVQAKLLTDSDVDADELISMITEHSEKLKSEKTTSKTNELAQLKEDLDKLQASVEELELENAELKKQLVPVSEAA